MVYAVEAQSVVTVLKLRLKVVQVASIIIVEFLFELWILFKGMD